MTAIVHMSAVTREWTLFYTNKVKFKLSETIKTYSVRNVWLQAACLLVGERGGGVVCFPFNSFPVCFQMTLLISYEFLQLNINALSSMNIF